MKWPDGASQKQAAIIGIYTVRWDRRWRTDMRLEDIRNDFPDTPEEIRNRIEQEVEKQMYMARPENRYTKHRAGRTLAASVAAVMLFSTTVFAGVSIYRMQREPVGKYGVDVKLVKEKSGQNGASPVSADTADAGAVGIIPDVTMQTGYLPDGMVQTEEGKYSYADHLSQGGVSIVFYRMDTGDSAFHMLHDDVRTSEDIKVNGHEGVYLEYPNLSDDETAFNQRIYIAYTDVHYVMQMYIGADLSKEEALRIAEGIQLIPVKDHTDQNIVHAWDWSDYLGSLEEDKKTQQAAEGADVKETASKEVTSKGMASKKEMQHTHVVGESFSLYSPDENGKLKQNGLLAKVSDVKITDDLSLLPSPADEELQKETDESGRLRPAEIRYIREGDTDTLSEVVKTRKVPQKFVYATVEYTNTTKTDLTDVLFFGTMQRMSEKNGTMHMKQEYEQPGAADVWTRAVNTGLSACEEMQYYDVHGGERHNNYIPVLKAGETVTVHMGWLVTEEESDTLYINLDTAGGAGEFTESGLLTGYVDIR